jgi:predicted GNAT family N-acyltransferase
MSQFTIKHVENEQELEDCYTIRKEVFVQEQKVPLEEEVDDYESVCDHFVVYPSEMSMPIGAGRLRPLNAREAKIERICIHPSYRKHGLGAAVMQEIERFARKNHYRCLMLHAQTQALGFYEAFGYINISDEPFDEAGIMHVKMQKEI